MLNAARRSSCIGTAPGASRPRPGRVESRARDPRHARLCRPAALLRAARYDAGGAVRGHALRVDGHRRVRLSRRSGRPPDEGIRLRRAARRAQRAARRHVGDVEVAGTRARRDTSCCAGSSAAAATRIASTRGDAELIDTARRELTPLLGITGDAALLAPVPLDAPEPAVRGRPPAARRHDRAARRRPARRVHHRQRLPRDRHSRLHRRRPRGRRPRRGLRGTPYPLTSRRGRRRAALKAAPMADFTTRAPKAVRSAPRARRCT